MHTIQHQNRIPLAIALFVSLAATAPAATPFGPNLMPNPGFEEATGRAPAPAGWTLILDKPGAARLTTEEQEAVAGKRCLALELGAPETRGNQTRVQSPIVACEPGWYLASFWYRHEFTGKEEPHRRFDVERLLDVTTATRDDVVYQYYYPVHREASGEWDHTFIVFCVRPGQQGVRFQFAYFNPNETRFLLDAVSLQRINEATASATAIEKPVVLKAGLAADPIADPAASDGRAWRCEEGKHVPGGKIIWSPQTILSPGLYRLRFRLRQEQASKAEPVFLTGSGDNGGATEYVRATDFKGTADYETFDLFYFYPFGGGHCINWRFPSSGTYRFDQILAEKVADVTMPEAWALLADGIKPSAAQPSGLAPAGQPAVLLAGLTEHAMGLEPALEACGLAAYRCDLQTVPGGIHLGLTPALPALDGVRLLIMADVPVRALAPAEQLRIRQFVENGGGLIVFGGFYGYGHGGMKGSFIEDLLPVSVKRSFDRERGTGELTEAKGWFPARLGGCAWVHEVTVKPGAQVCWRVGSRPAVVAGTCGKGRVIAITATMLGEPAKPFWESADWAARLRDLVAGAAVSHDAEHRVDIEAAFRWLNSRLGTVAAENRQPLQAPSQDEPTGDRPPLNRSK